MLQFTNFVYKSSNISRAIRQLYTTAAIIPGTAVFIFDDGPRENRRGRLMCNSGLIIGVRIIIIIIIIVRTGRCNAAAAAAIYIYILVYIQGGSFSSVQPFVASAMTCCTSRE